MKHCTELTTRLSQPESSVTNCRWVRLLHLMISTSTAAQFLHDNGAQDSTTFTSSNEHWRVRCSGLAKTKWKTSALFHGKSKYYGQESSKSMPITFSCVRPFTIVADLNIQQPRTKKVDAFLSLLHVPHYQVECVAREKALVSGVIHLLTSQVPCAKHHIKLMLEEEQPSKDHTVYAGKPHT